MKVKIKIFSQTELLLEEVISADNYSAFTRAFNERYDSLIDRAITFQWLFL